MRVLIIRNAFLGSGLTCKGILANDISECSNRILQNDPLNYGFSIINGQYEEYHSGIFIRPSKPNLCYEFVKLRKKNIKNITTEKLKKRFKQIKKLVVDNKDNFINLQFDINTKI